MSRPSAERVAEIRARTFHNWSVAELLAEIDALTAERDALAKPRFTMPWETAMRERDEARDEAAAYKSAAFKAADKRDDYRTERDEAREESCRLERLAADALAERDEALKKAEAQDRSFKRVIAGQAKHLAVMAAGLAYFEASPGDAQGAMVAMLAELPEMCMMAPFLEPLFKALQSGEAKNYATASLTHEGADWEITLQRSGGMSPCEHIEKMKTERDEARRIAGEALDGWAKYLCLGDINDIGPRITRLREALQKVGA